MSLDFCTASKRNNLSYRNYVAEKCVTFFGLDAYTIVLQSTKRMEQFDPQPTPHWPIDDNKPTLSNSFSLA